MPKTFASQLPVVGISSKCQGILCVTSIGTLTYVMEAQAKPHAGQYQFFNKHPYQLRFKEHLDKPKENSPYIQARHCKRSEAIHCDVPILHLWIAASLRSSR
jgi:hypothetical protein